MTKGFSGAAARSGFSLVELSIVLVILGLLTGGILTGQNLIRAAELRSVTADIQRYQTTVMTFRDKYFALPGDMKNATDFWGNADTGSVGGQCSTPQTDTGTATETCNGDGDGIIDDYTTTSEMFRFWQHLANAGLIEGSYTGVHGSGGTGHGVAGINEPASKLSNGGFSARHLDNVAASVGEHYAHPASNVIFFGDAGPGGYHWWPILTPEDAWNIDRKVDDGRPAYGKITTWRATGSYNTNCATSGDETVAEYNLTHTDVDCTLIIKAGF